MEKLIKGRRYNTDTAIKIGTQDGETLYRKSNGEFFLQQGTELVPMIYTQAAEWAKDCLAKDVWDKYFGAVKEGKKIVRAYSLPEGIVEIAKREAAQTGENVSDVIARAIMFAYGS